MISNFADHATEDIFDGKNSKDAARIPANIHRAARKRLLMLNAAIRLDDLKFPPGNQLEALVGDLKGRHSIRINDQWRIVFRWAGSNASDVVIVDYH
jgi:proteic killer suppression protein